jgi:hypothetical protein
MYRLSHVDATLHTAQSKLKMQRSPTIAAFAAAHPHVVDVFSVNVICAMLALKQRSR